MIKNILFVDDSVPDYDIFLQSVNEGTKAIPYSFNTTYEQLRQAIPGPVDQLGIVFVKGTLFLGRPFTEQYDFFASLVQQFEIKHLDFLACDTLNDPEWVTFYAKFTTVIIGASNNKTGNIQYGGDWTMESSSEDIDGIYFTKQIEYYKYLLDVRSRNMFYTAGDGTLYGMGRNAEYQLGKDHYRILVHPTEVRMNGSSISGIQKIRCGSGYFNETAYGNNINPSGNLYNMTFFLKDNKLYGFGRNGGNLLSASSTSTIITSPVELTLPIGGTIADFDCCLDGANPQLYVIVGGRVYTKNNSPTFQEIKTNDSNEGMATIISVEEKYPLIVFNNEVYQSTYTGVTGGNPSGITLTKMNFPVGTTGTITKVRAGINAAYNGVGESFVIRGGLLYKRTTGDFTQVVTLGTPAISLTSVTDIAISVYSDSNYFVVNNNVLYALTASGDPLTKCGLTWTTSQVITTPAGTIQSISTRRALGSLAILIDGVVYGSGKNLGQLGSPTGFRYGFSVVNQSWTPTSSVPTSNVTILEAGGKYLSMIMNDKLYLCGDNFDSSLGKEMISAIEYVPIPIQLNGVNLTNVPRRLICGDYRLGTWLAVGEKLYATGNEGGGTFSTNFLGLNSVRFSPTFIEIPVHSSATGSITFVSRGYRMAVVAKGNLIYGAYSSAAGYSRSDMTQLRPILFPGVSGIVKGLFAASDGCIVLLDDKLYGFGQNLNNRFGAGTGLTTDANQVWNSNTFVQLKYQGSPITGVSKVVMNDQGTLFLKDNELWYSGKLTDTPTTTTDFIQLSPPAGTIEKIEAGNAFFIITISGVLHGFGWHDSGSLGSSYPLTTSSTTISKIYTNGNTTPISDVTDTQVISQTVYYTIPTGMYGVGGTADGMLGASPNNNINIYSTNQRVFITTDVQGTILTIDSSSPSFGPNNATFTIQGDLLTNINSVQFGPILITNIVKTSKTATFFIPSGSGTVVPVVNHSDGKTYTLTAFNYSNPKTLISMAYLKKDGTTYNQVTSTIGYGNRNLVLKITGLDLLNTTSVLFGTKAASFTVISSTEASLIVPAQDTQGILTNVVFRDTYGTSSNVLSFQYTQMTVDNVTTESGTTVSTAPCGSKLVICGYDLGEATSVYFDTLATSILTSTVRLIGGREYYDLTVTVPNGLMSNKRIRVIDRNANLAEYPVNFTCTLSPVSLGQTPGVVEYSAASPTKTFYVSGSILYTFNASGVISPLFQHSLPILGLTYLSGFLYFGDSEKVIYKINPDNYSTTNFAGVSTAVLVTFVSPENPVKLPRSSMTISSIVAYGNLLLIVCKNTGASSDALLTLDPSTRVYTLLRDYQGITAYNLRRITYNSLTNFFYATAVPFNGTLEVTLDQGRVIQFTPAGVLQNVSFMTGINNPIDIAMLNGYLVIDGVLLFTSPINGSIVSTFDTTATTITVDGSNAYFTSTSGSNSLIKQITVTARVEDVFTLTNNSNYSPKRGPARTMVFISGNKLSSNITSVTVNGTTVEYYVNDMLLAVRIPAQTAPAITILVNGSYSYDFTYANPDIVNVIPLYKQSTRYYHFTGNSLGNIVYVGFGDTQTTTLTTKYPIVNSTDTSFDCLLDTLPVNSSRILLEDAFGVVTYEDAAMFTLSSETCFVAGTPILTDQGLVAIDKIDPSIHTIDQKEIVAITKIRYIGDSLVLLEQDSLRKKYPTRDTLISPKHKIYYKGKMKTAESFVGKQGVRIVPYEHQFLYNVLLNTHDKMKVNGLLCETLHPKNPIAKYFTKELCPILRPDNTH
jgi:alpha-tubulin suppressor-like RCC1 family protein